ncbi:MAG: hypothetical protein JWN70_2043 [Planctomycetaceae bacterium]|nr:hypothetical protein [Planctomycetaceae bacterium]
MKLAIMQPYLFPYIGYFQLLAVVDRFVAYDDVNFIKQGWINRNRIYVGNRVTYFTVPLHHASSFARICDVRIADVDWQTPMLKTIQQSYFRTPYFRAVYPIVESVLQCGTASIGTMARQSLLAVRDYLGLRTEIVETSAIYKNQQLSGQQRVLDICRQEHCYTYLNATGGGELYSRSLFAEHGIDLRFLRSVDVRYEQLGKPFVSNLSIIDLLMYNSPHQVGELLTRCVLE